MDEAPFEFRSAADLAAAPASARVVRGIDVRDEDLVALAERPDLRAVLLDGCFALTDGALRHVSQVHALEELFVSGDGITDEGLRHLAGLERLQELGIDAHLTGWGFRHLAGLPRLATLHLPVCPQLEPEALSCLASLPALEDLCFYACRRMTDVWLTYVAEIPSLRALRLTRCEGVTEAGLAALQARRPGVAVERA